MSSTGWSRRLNALMWERLPPFPPSSAALLEEIKWVERGEADEWEFESPEVCITCTPETVTIEGKSKPWREPDRLRVDLAL
jgi:hypothetical protein